MGGVVVGIDERICAWVGGGERDSAARGRKQVDDADADYRAVQGDLHVCEGDFGGGVHGDELVVGAGGGEIGVSVWDRLIGGIELEGRLEGGGGDGFGNYIVCGETFQVGRVVESRGGGTETFFWVTDAVELC